MNVKDATQCRTITSSQQFDTSQQIKHYAAVLEGAVSIGSCKPDIPIPDLKLLNLTFSLHLVLQCSIARNYTNSNTFPHFAKS